MRTYLLTSDPKCVEKAKIFLKTEDITLVESINDISSAERKSCKLIIDSNYLSKVAEGYESLACFSKDNISVLIENRIFCASDEQRILEERNSVLDYMELKIRNKALVFFDYINGRAVQNGLPEYIQIETTSYCNARCIMCRHYYAGNKEAKHLDFNSVSDICSVLDICYVVGLQGMGEPFLHPYFSDIIEKYISHGVKISATTNLSILDDKILDLIKNHFASIHISCDGACKETFEAIRKGLNFDTVYSNMKRLSEYCPNVYKEINVVLMRQNITELEAFIDLAADVGIQTVIFHNMQPSLIMKNFKDSMVNYPLVLDYFCQKAYLRGKENGIRVLCPVPFTSEKSDWSDSTQKEFERMKNAVDSHAGISNEAFCQEEKELYKKIPEKFEITSSKVSCEGICDWLLNQAYINIDGSASICCSRSIYKTGDLNSSTDFRSIWNSELSRKMREIFYSGYLPSCCADCVMVKTGQLQFLRIN